MKSTIIILPMTLAILTFETWVNQLIKKEDPVQQENSEPTDHNNIILLLDSIIDAIFRPEVLPGLVMMLGCLLYADMKSHKFVEYMENLSVLGGVFLFPLFILVLATYSFLDSLLVLAGYGSVIVWLRSSLENTFANGFIRDSASLLIHFLMFLPLMLLLAILIYGNKKNQKFDPAHALKHAPDRSVPAHRRPSSGC